MSLTFAAQAEPANGTIVVQNSRFVPDLQRTFPARLILETRIGLKSTVESEFPIGRCSLSDPRSSIVFAVLIPRPHARNPPADICAEVFVLKPKGASQGGLFVNENKQVECRPNRYTVLENTDIAKNQSLPENQRYDRHIHRISHIAIPAADD